MMAYTKKGNWFRPVRCVETGEEYDSIRDCSRATGIPYTSIIYSMEHNTPIRGYHFVDSKPREE